MLVLIFALSSSVLSTQCAAIKGAKKIYPQGETGILLLLSAINTIVTASSESLLLQVSVKRPESSLLRGSEQVFYIFKDR